jgi:hypothetical protein
MNNATRVAAVAVALGLAACGGEPQWTGTIVDSAGVQIVQNTDLGLWQEGANWTLEEDLRIGAVEGQPDYQFGQVGFIAVGSLGQIYVMDAQARHIKAFDAEGTYQQTIGSPGSGPGEIGQQAVFVLRAAGDTLIVPDVGNRRINRYTPSGEALPSTPVDLANGLPLVFGSNLAGQIAMQVRPLSLPNRPAPDSLDRIIELNQDGTFGDTLMVFPSGRSFDFGGSSPTMRVYSTEPAWDLADTHLYYAVNDIYRIGKYDLAGNLQLVVTKPFERLPVSENDQSAVISFIENAARAQGAPPSAIPMIRQMVQFGEFFPAFQSFSTGPWGTLWVQQVQSAGDLTPEELEQFNLIEDQGSPDWDVFDVQGRYLGIVTMPRRFQPRLFTEEHVYGVWRDDLDVQYVMRLKILGSLAE